MTITDRHKVGTICQPYSSSFLSFPPHIRHQTAVKQTEPGVNQPGSPVISKLGNPVIYQISRFRILSKQWFLQFFPKLKDPEQDN